MEVLKADDRMIRMDGGPSSEDAKVDQPDSSSHPRQ
jgi:hypothetical protein